MLLYKFFNPNPAGKMVRDCVVRAICKAENLSWEFAYLSICAAGLVEYDMPDGNDVWGIYFKNRGYTREYIPNTCHDCYTVRRFCEEHPKGLFVLCTGNHAVTVVDGDYYDAWDSGNEVPMYFWTKEKEREES